MDSSRIGFRNQNYGDKSEYQFDVQKEDNRDKTLTVAKNRFGTPAASLSSIVTIAHQAFASPYATQRKSLPSFSFFSNLVNSVKNFIINRLEVNVDSLNKKIEKYKDKVGDDFIESMKKKTEGLSKHISDLKIAKKEENKTLIKDLNKRITDLNKDIHEDLSGLEKSYKTQQSAEKMSGIADNIFKKINKGRAKSVHIRKYSKTDTNVYFTPTGLLKKTEIKDEVRISKSIANDLIKQELINIMKGQEGTFKAALLADYLIKKYETPAGIAQAMKCEGMSLEEAAAKLTEEFKKLNDVKDVDPETAKNVIDFFSKPENIQKIESRFKNLGIDLTEVSKKERIEGKYTVKMQKAESDVETYIRSKNQAVFPKSLDLGVQMLRGWSNLHQTGRIHGDPKPDNFLLYRNGDELTIKMSDWGKTKTVGADESVLHTGNPRFCPPEGRASQKGEVYSAGLILIRLLEEQFLDGTQAQDAMLVKAADFSHSPIKVEDKRRGVEKYILTHSDCPQTETTTLKGKFVQYGGAACQVVRSSLGVRPASNSQAEAAVHSYIDKLVENLKAGNGPSAAEQIEKIGGLLKRMTQADPLLRPSMEEAAETLSQIRPLLTSHAG